MPTFTRNVAKEAVLEAPAHQVRDVEDKVENLGTILSLLDSIEVLSHKEHGEHGVFMGVDKVKAL